MKPLTFSLFLLFQTCIFSSITAQELSKHKWKNRVLLIITTSNTNEQLKEQMVAIQKNAKDIEDRKLIVYSVTPETYTVLLSRKNTQTEFHNSTLFKEIHSKNTPFEVLLIGLDGTEKLRQTEVLETEKLFTLIDGMPMRQSEVLKQ